MKDEAFKSRARRCLSKVIKGISVVMLMFLASTIETDLLGQAEASSVKLVHEKDLVIGGQSAAITWSPDSKSLAFVRWGPGVAAIIDVETGALTELPESQLNGMSTIAWSLDARLLAVSALSEFKVIDLTDHKSKLVHRYTESKDLGFEHASAFSKDGKTLLLQRKGERSPLLYQIDVGSGDVTPFLSSPFGERYTGPWKGRLRWLQGHLHFTAEIDRLDEELKPAVPALPNSPMMHMPHPSCYDFDLGDGTAVLSTRSVDVNKWIGLGTPVLIANTCALSADTRFVITNQPTSLDSSLTKGKDAPVSDVLFRVFDLQSGAPVNGFDTLSDRNRIAKQFDLHPSQPWAVTVASGIALPSSEVSLWNFNSGELLARVKGPAFLRDPAISPDGERIAFWASNGVIPIYKLQQLPAQRRSRHRGRTIARNAHVRKMRNRTLAERVGASTAMRNSRTYSRQRFGARSRPAIASCCTKNTAKDFANKMQNPGHLSLGHAAGLLV